MSNKKDEPTRISRKVLDHYIDSDKRSLVLVIPIETQPEFFCEVKALFNKYPNLVKTLFVDERFCKWTDDDIDVDHYVETGEERPMVRTLSVPKESSGNE